ncbi:F-box/RNI-like superfamily protein isoform 1 [Dorcoceras hygrometricum]|uniref:F-box/RNI-like superfamily protein isoform 1 n=1 Tax=Dorcoceras hygrometricum TaxID=472368 RepID=A0A2Z7A1Y2_9LAMI|nr:F-box/RNI-like superfamily protein isoform 1 [Dorcoceras hygrometricum]
MASAPEPIQDPDSMNPGLEQLSSALLATIMTKLDVPSIQSMASTCKTFRSCATDMLSFIPNFHLLDIAPSMDLLGPLLRLDNPYLRSLKVDCTRLDDSSLDFLARPSLQELCLRNCADFSGRLLYEGVRCLSSDYAFVRALCSWFGMHYWM